MSKPATGEEHTMTIDRLAYGGEGVGRLSGDGTGAGMAVFVPRTAPGDRVRVRLARVKRRHAGGEIVELQTPGPDRIEPECPHYAQGCGGCSWQHLTYDAQKKAKEDVVRESLERIGGYKDLPIAAIVGATDRWNYRNKMEFAFNVRDGLGLHPTGRWREVIPVHACRL